MPACRRDARALAELAFIGLLTLAAPRVGLAQADLPPIAVNPQLLGQPKTLQLEIFINGQPVGFIEEFVQRPAENAFYARRSDLEEAGIRTPPGKPDERVNLASLGCEFHYDDTAQRMAFTLGDAQRLPRIYNARGTDGRVTPQVDPGLLVNYSLFGGSLTPDRLSQWSFRGSNVTLDARAFSKFGVFSQTGIIGRTLYNSKSSVLRLDSTYVYTQPESMLTYRAGDLITGGLAWTRPVRVGGLQLQRDFLLRPDLVTRPLPSISGSAAVPSTVDVFINGVKTYSQDIAAGPYRITDLPGNGGNGEARALIRDASGRETQTSLSFQNAAQLLRPGLTDFSVEAGFARLNYGLSSQDYDRRPLGAATLRRGLSDWLTVETHAEGGARLVNGGVGAVVGLSRLGAFSAAGAASHVGGALGWQAFVGWDAQFKWLSVSASTQRASRRYEDLASVTAPSEIAQSQLGVSLGGVPLPPSATTGVHPLLALDRFSVGAPLPFDSKTSVNVSLVHLRQRDAPAQKLVTASLSRSLPKYGGVGPGTLFVTGFADLSSQRSRGVYAGLSMPFGLDRQVSAGVSWDASSRAIFSTEAQKPQPLEDNTYGYRLRDLEGRTPYHAAAASFRSAYGQIAAQVENQGGQTTGTAQIDGSLALMGGGFFIGNRVESSFAVVDTGKAGVPVLQDNRVIGTTNGGGKLLVTNLRPYEPNHLAIDTSALPPDQDIASTSRTLAPFYKAGVVVNYGGRQTSSNAIVVVTGADGKFIEAGHRARLNGGKETFVVGYDGRVYVTGLGAANRLSVDLGTRDCVADFPFSPQPGVQSLIRGVACR